MVKLVFVDMDDTFLTPEKTISLENQRILDSAYEKEIQFVPCSGRNITSLPSLLINHPSVHYAICCNGALICEVNAGRVLHETIINKQIIFDLYQKIQNLPITFDIFGNGKVFTLTKDWSILDQLPVEKTYRKQLKNMREPFNGSLEELLTYVKAVCRINIFFLNQADANKIWGAVDMFPELTRTTSLPCNVEITHTGVNKGTGVRWLCNKLNISIKDTIAFGDSNNDIEMLKVAGDGVAMGNANSICKAAANHVTRSCTQDGVAYYLTPIFAKI